MTGITRKHLELAALAIGEVVECTEAEFHGCEDTSTLYTGVMLRGVQVAWRPHTDIGDAARLAVKLGIRVSVGPFGALAQPERAGDVLLTHDGTQPGKERAYRHAITLCAAGTGRRMKEAK